MMLRKNKKSLIFALTLMSLSFMACAKNKGDLPAVKAEESMQIKEENLEIKKLDSVLMKMSGRFKADVQILNKEEFLQDLKEVLQSRDSFSKDDLSPFYLIDKTHNVGKEYVPASLIHLENNDNYLVNKDNLSLRPEAFDALNRLGAAAKADGVTLTISSTYRSYDYQYNLFNYWVKVDGLEEAERESARPGTSQHQLGMALDFAPVDDAFDQTKAGQWVYKNASDYGWSLSFPKMYEDVTGYRWESWHFRYIGVPACNFQKKYFNNVQQFMIEFIDAWEKE